MKLRISTQVESYSPYSQVNDVLYGPFVTVYGFPPVAP